MKSKVEKELNKKNKRFDFKGLFKSFVSSSDEELTEEEIILNDASLNMQERNELLSGLKSTESFAHSLFSENTKKGIRKTNSNIYIKPNEKIITKAYERKQKEQGDRAD